MAKLNMAVKLTASRQSTQSTPIDVMRYILPVIIAATSLYVWFSPFLGPSDSYRSGDSIHPLSPSTSLQPSGLIGDSICEYHTLNQIDEQLRPDLRALIHTPFFSHYKVNLHKQCPFWDVHGLCTQRECAVEILGEDQIPEELTSKRSSTDVSTISFGIQSVQKQDYSDEDFCIVEDVDSSDSIYVSLVSNPERFTGFSGESANKIWRLIYEESCFKDWNTCLEKRAFYRIISGLHGSISMHICDEFCNVTTNKWGRNMLCYHYRVGKFPERIENVYFNYAILLSAINKMSMYFHTYDFCIANKQMEHCTKDLIGKVISAISSSPPSFDPKTFFKAPQSDMLKEEFKDRFRNVSRIMDCVECEICRLWGKVQVSGLGTALKILFSFDDYNLNGQSSYHLLEHSEIVALFNTFNRFSESIVAIQHFQAKYPDYPELK